MYCGDVGREQGTEQTLVSRSVPDSVAEVHVEASFENAVSDDALIAYVPKLLLRWPVDAAHQVRTGTLVSADISGFTSLSERLAQKGREGAEELTVIVNDCFTGMIDACDKHGGDVLKFGGDALLVLFEGERHTQRACRAATAMRQTLKRQRRTTDGRRVRLAVSIGIHSGDFDLFVVRDKHDELIVSGAGSSATVDAEAAASAGEILLTASAAAELPAAWLGQVTEDGVLLARTYGASQLLERDAAFRKPVDFVPPEQAAQILAGATNEHRQVSVSFVEFSHADDMPRDELATKLQMLAASVHDACDRHGVHWLSSDVYDDGGKFILTAGVPTSRGGDEDRMLRAIRTIIDEDPGLHLRAGVNRGYVFAGDLGAPTRRVYTAMGDAVNLAARLMAKATPGEIVASRAIVDWASSEFEYEPLDPFMVKGKSMPIHAGRVGRILGRRTDLDRVDTDLCGRATDLGLLMSRAADARAGRGSVTVITGEPGIGKSRLALEVIRRNPDLALAFVRCQPHDRLVAYAVIEPLLRTMLGIDVEADAVETGHALVAWLGEHHPSALPLTPLLAVAFGAMVESTPQAEAVAAEFRAARTLQLLVELIHLVVVTPTVVYIDDLNLADDQTRDVVHVLHDAANETPLMVIATSIPGDAPHLNPVHLGPLTESDVTDLLDLLLGEQTIAADVVREVVHRSGGNPLFLGELVRCLSEDPNAPMPDSLEALVSSSVDALEPTDRQLLRQASVLGSEVEIELLGRVTSDGLIRRQDRWDRLSRFLEWAAPGVVRFRHDTYWRVVYSGLSFAARRDAHRRVVELIEADLAESLDGADAPDPQLISRLAAHSARSGDHARTWKYATSAADHAAEKSLFGVAAQLYTMALESRSGADRSVVGEVAERAASTFNMAGSFEAANSALVVSLRSCANPADQARLLRLRGEIAERTGEVRRAATCFKRARAIWRSEEFGAGVVEQARLGAAEAALAYRQARYADAWVLASAALAQGNFVEDPATAARAGLILNNLLFHMRLRGFSVRGPDLTELYREAGDRVGEAHHLNNLAVDLYFDGDWSTAAALYRDAAELCITTGDVVYEATAINNIAEILSDQGRYSEADTMFRHAARTWRSVGFATGIALVEANLGRLATRTGDFDAATDLLSSSLARFEQLGAQAFVHEVQLRMIDNDLSARRLADRTQLDAFVVLARTTDWDANLSAYAERLMATFERQAGDAAAARIAIDRSIEAARRAGLEFELALALAEGDGTSAEATAIFDRLGVDMHSAAHNG
jgi:class 3 adenylate cyclase/tetratricopeptide (TPR) repeat protein